MTRHLVCVGDLNLDIVITPEGELAVGSDCPGTVAMHGGGSAANTAAWAARQGVATRFVGAIGDDPTGDFLERELASHNVDVHPVVRTGTTSRTIAALVGLDGNRSLVSNKNAAVALTAEDYATNWLEDAAWLHLTGYTYIAPQSRTLFDHLTDTAKRKDIPFSIDPSAAAMLSQMCDLPSVLRAFGGARVLFPSHDEAEYLTDRPDPEAAAIDLLSVAHTVAVTCGADGVHVADRVHGTHHIPAEVVPIVNTLGCGDAFAGGFLAATLSGSNPIEATKLGVSSATVAAQRTGGR